MVFAVEFREIPVALGVDEMRAPGCVSHFSDVLIMFNSEGKKRQKEKTVGKTFKFKLKSNIYIAGFGSRGGFSRETTRSKRCVPFPLNSFIKCLSVTQWDHSP